MMLTPREKQIASLVREGLPNKQIAARLGVSPKTVEFHLANAKRRLGGSASPREMLIVFVLTSSDAP